MRVPPGPGRPEPPDEVLATVRTQEVQFLALETDRHRVVGDPFDSRDTHIVPDAAVNGDEEAVDPDGAESEHIEGDPIAALEGAVGQNAPDAEFVGERKQDRGVAQQVDEVPEL